MSGKANLRCVGYKPVCRGTLRGFASIAFTDLHMVVHEIAIHEKNGKSWAQPPARPWLKDGVAVKGDNGKIIYSPPLIEFATPKVRWAWSDAVLRQVLAFDPRALECREVAA
jgi:hypothetical protein